MSNRQEPTMTAFEQALLRQAESIAQKQLILHLLRKILGDIYQNITDCRIITGELFGEVSIGKKIFIAIQDKALQDALRLFSSKLGVKLYIAEKRRPHYAAIADKIGLFTELEESLERERLLATMLAVKECDGNAGEQTRVTLPKEIKESYDVMSPKRLARELFKLIDAALDEGKFRHDTYQRIADICEALYSHSIGWESRRFEEPDPATSEWILVDDGPTYCYKGKVELEGLGIYVVELSSTAAIPIPENHQFVLDHTI